MNSAADLRATGLSDALTLPASNDRPLRIAIVAGEESGDRLGGALMRALSARRRIEWLGLGGEDMAAAGLAPIFPLHEIAVMGIDAIVRRLPQLLARIAQVARAVDGFRPDVLVIIDAPEFTHRVARRVRRRQPGVPIVNYVSPTVWAWRPGRARAMRPYVDLVLAVFPFEPAVHERLGGPRCVYVGHPLFEAMRAARVPGSAKTGEAVPGAVSGAVSDAVERVGAVVGDAAGEDAAWADVGASSSTTGEGFVGSAYGGAGKSAVEARADAGDTATGGDAVRHRGEAEVELSRVEGSGQKSEPLGSETGRGPVSQRALEQQEARSVAPYAAIGGLQDPAEVLRDGRQAAQAVMTAPVVAPSGGGRDDLNKPGELPSPAGRLDMASLATGIGAPVAGATPGGRSDATAAAGRAVPDPSATSEWRRETLLILPGSRRGEIDRLMPVFGATLALLRPDLPVKLLAVTHLRERIEAYVAGWAVRPEIVSGEEAKLLAFREAKAALAASGTVTLELAAARVPMVVAYKLDFAYRQVKRLNPYIRLVTAPSMVLANIIIGRNAIPSFLEEEASAKTLAAALRPLIADGSPERFVQETAFDDFELAMSVSGSAADRAAEAVLSVVGSR